MSVEAIDDQLLKIARAVRRRYGLPKDQVDDLRQRGWVEYLQSSDLKRCYWEMRHVGYATRNGYRHYPGCSSAPRFISGIDLALFQSVENTEARAIARHELNKIIALCSQAHIKTLQTFIVPQKYDMRLNNRLSRLRRFIKQHSLV